jgi:hypothetical protein
MKKQQARFREWCRTIGVTLAAILIVSAIAGVYFSGLTQLGQTPRVTMRPGQQPGGKPAQAEGAGPAKTTPKQTATTRSKPAGPGSSREASRAKERTVSGDLARNTKDAPKRRRDNAGERSRPIGLTVAASDVDPGPAMEEVSSDAAPAKPAISSPPSRGAEKFAASTPSLSPVERNKAEARFQKVVGDLHQKLHDRSADSVKRRAKAEADLNAIDDPLAVRALWRFLSKKTEHHNLLARTLSRINSADSTEMLAALATYSEDEKARRLAAAALRGRDLDHFVESLIGVLASPMTHRVYPMEVPGQDPARVLHVAGAWVEYQLIYPAPAKPRPPGVAPGVYDAEHPYQFLSREERQLAAEYNQSQIRMARDATTKQIEADIETLKGHNLRIKELNGRAIAILRAVTGQYLEADREQWMRWLAERRGRRYVPPANAAKLTMAQVVTPLYEPTFIQVAAAT